MQAVTLIRCVFIAFAIFIAGCATRPISNIEAINVENDRIIDSTYIHPGPDLGRVTIKRDSGVSGSACSSRIFVNAKPVADIRSSEKIVLHLPAGDYVFSAWPNGMCGGGMTEVRAVVKSGVELSFRVGYGSNGDFTIHATAF